METAVVIAVVAIAGVVVARRLYQEAMGKKGCSCEGKCPTKEECGKGKGDSRKPGE